MYHPSDKVNGKDPLTQFGMYTVNPYELTAELLKRQPRYQYPDVHDFYKAR